MKTEDNFRFPSDKETSAKNITIPLWAVWPVLVMFMSATVYFVNTLNAINGKLDNAGQDRWKRSHQREWSHQLHDRNQSIVVPDPDAVAAQIDGH